MAPDSAVQLATIDIVLLVVTTVSILGTALIVTFVTRRRNTSSSTEAEDFFLSGRNMSWWAIGCSLFAANIGSEHYIAQAGTASLNGFPVALYEWLAAFLLLLLGYVFAPIYMRAAIITIPEFFEKRFNKWCRLALAIVCSVSYILTKIAATLYASAVFLEVILGWDLYISVPIILFVTAFYTALGGLTAVIFTDILQVVIALSGGFAALGVAMVRIGGYQGIADTFREVKLEKMLHIIREPSDPDYAWTGMFFGQMVASIWYWCLDQEMAQRVLSAKSLRHARSGVIMAGFLKILPPFVILFPGLAARAMYERCAVLSDPLFSNWCDADLRDPANSNRAYPLLVVKEFPVGVVGILVAAMLAAMTGALSAVFNSSATVLTFDIYQRFINPKASQRRLVLVGRLATAGMAVLSIGWLPVIKAQDGPLYLIVQDVITHFAPPLTSIFIVGVLFPSVNGTGALVGMFAGLLLGLVQYAWNLIMKKTCDAAEGALGDTFYCIHFNHFAGIIFIVTCCVTFLVSWKTGGVPNGPEREKIRAMTVWHGRDGWWMKRSKSEEDVEYASVETNAPSEETEEGDERSRSFPPSPNQRTPALASPDFSMDTLNANEDDDVFPMPATTFSIDDEKIAPPSSVVNEKKSPTERVWERVNDAMAVTLVVVVCSLVIVWR